MDPWSQLGFSDAVVEAVESLTKREDEENDYEAFMQRLAPNPLAREVKLADLRDNCDLGRIAEPTEGDHERVRKYRRAIAYLERWE